MTATPPGTIDFTMMYVTHDAFRRDLGRLLAAAVAGTAHTPQIQAGWANFKHQLLLHHTVEDDVLWPRLADKVTHRPDDLLLLADMEAEHARIDPLLTSVEAALEEPAADLAEQVDRLRTALVEHLDHEEKSALPLIQEVLTPADWRVFASRMRERQGLRGAAVYIPWITDSMPAAERERFLAHFPPPVRVINRRLWEPRYRKSGMWAV
ncbi:hemerythrin domain-containing protein [Streptomyces aculeolatus]|uniref:hemerythrin domain-containing protein n=1 Tax=Streptomyces aculeolatus TaxID=270689 RepID=UPI001CEC524C|nr:hemerythrin domain-containing protein [Streptomyces aculeolatus]